MSAFAGSTPPGDAAAFASAIDDSACVSCTTFGRVAAPLSGIVTCSTTEMTMGSVTACGRRGTKDGAALCVEKGDALALAEDDAVGGDEMDAVLVGEALSVANDVDEDAARAVLELVAKTVA